jgi:hypothetical protein
MDRISLRTLTLNTRLCPLQGRVMSCEISVGIINNRAVIRGLFGPPVNSEKA